MEKSLILNFFQFYDINSEKINSKKNKRNVYSTAEMGKRVEEHYKTL